jgi:hypothetical protein
VLKLFSVIKNKKMKQKTLKISSREDLKYSISRAFLGIFIVIIGLVFLLNNLNVCFMVVGFDNLWPLLIIFIGLSLFKKKNVTSTIIGSIVTIICAILFFYSIASYNATTVDFSYQAMPTPIVVAKDMNMKKAEVELNAVAGEVNIYGIESENLIEGRYLSNIMEGEINQSIDNSIQKVNVSFNSKKDLMNDGQVHKNSFSIGIDENTPLNFVLNSGASSNKVDLSEIEAKNILISTGASNLSLKLGDKINSSVTIEAGASSIGLNLPTDTGVRLKIESGFSSQELPGLSLINDNTYQSSDYDSKDKKIDIEITMGMANLKIDWYSPIKKKEISLFYYNQAEDKENSCDNSYILPVKRTIIDNENQIDESIKLLIDGKLTEQEKREGFTTEFPNKDFKLLGSKFENGVLTLTFTEVPGFTTGGACRVKILGSEIIRTAKQFSGVNKVVLEPETIFEP